MKLSRIFAAAAVFYACLAGEASLLAENDGRAIVEHSRGLFVSAIENPTVLSSRQTIEGLIDFSKKARIRTLFIQVYRSNKAWFPSRHADTGPYRAGLADVGEDPFALLIRKAHAEGIQVHAWINLLSLSANEDAPILKKYGPEILTQNREGKKTLADYKIDNQYFLEPGDLRVQDTLSGVVEEIVRAYPELDGIQLDYIRYPDVRPDYGYTKINMERFKKSTGLTEITKEDPAWQRWKYDQVTGLVRRLVRKARSIRPDIQVSTTGLMSYSRASLESFQDWRSWSQSGLVDACEEAGPRSCVIFYYGSVLENKKFIQSLVN